MRSWVSIVLVALAGLVVLACGGDTSDGPRFGSGGTGGVTLTCDTLVDPPADCDKVCTSDTQCEASFCDSGVCVANCTPTQGCGENWTCNVRGRCIANPSTGGTGGTGNVDCQSVTITPTRSIPNVMFLVDQSGSMNMNDFGDENLNRWTAAHSAITQVISEAQSVVRFGLTTYESDDGFGGASPECPVFGPADPPEAGPIGFFDLNQASQPIGTDYPSTFPGGEDTPTGDSIDALVDWIQLPGNTPPAEGPTIIVLATDGEPDSCEFPNPANGTQTAQARGEAVTAAEASHAAGIDLFVLWVGDLSDDPMDPTRSHMQDVANAGIDGTGTVYVGDDPENLSHAFVSIISDSISCDVQMDKRFDDKEKACNDPASDVQLNGEPLPCSDTDGWRVKPGVDDVIELVGSACDTFKSGDVTFSATFPCGAIVVE